MTKKNWLQEEYEYIFKTNFNQTGYLSYKKVKYILREVFAMIERKDLIIESQKMIIDFYKYLEQNEKEKNEK